MLGARIDVVEAPIWNFKACLMPLLDKKRQQLWSNELKRADWTETIVKNTRSAHTYQKRLNEVLSYSYGRV